jgi:guanylate kinase
MNMRMKKMYKVIALVGEAGAGKDSLMQAILELRPSLHEIVSCTTRPKREGEAHGVNYFYYTPEKFGEMVLRDEMLECTVFNDWFYGTSYDSVRSDCVNIGVFNPAGVEALEARGDVELYVVWVTASKKTRLLRQLNREEDPDVDEIIRRYRADQLDFAEFETKSPTLIVYNEETSLSSLAKSILPRLEQWTPLGNLD